MKIKLIASIVAAAAMSGCAIAPSPERQAQIEEIKRTVPTCSGHEDCNAKWEAAQLWVVHNSGYKIQTATNVLIQTFNPSQYSSLLAVQVTKEPVGGGMYRIVMNAWCDNYGCRPDKYKAALDFNRTVGAATP